ncbi:hypothetical protein F5Y17DRAFT_71300 [Xylariaceae sp. FL0594]|nr:hypothetical protein F5Y17DRAFT_71300 [Xylariaceae sp. FL0594]
MTVSRTMYEEAIHVLYSRNRIVVVPHSILYAYPGAILLNYNPNFELEASSFIRRHRRKPHLLRHLRNVELVFPFFPDPLRDGIPPLPAWKAAVELLRAHANIPALSLYLHMACFKRHNPRWHQQVDRNLIRRAQPYSKLLTLMSHGGGRQDPQPHFVANQHCQQQL